MQDALTAERAVVHVLPTEPLRVGQFSRPAGRGDVQASDFEAIAAWRRWMRGQGIAESTIRGYTYGVFRLFSEFVEGPLESATEDHVAAFMASLSKHGGARVQYFRGLRSFFRYCHARGLIGLDSTAGLRVRKLPRKPPIALTEEELIRYLIAAAWRHPRRAWALMLAFGLGTRRMELTEIRPEDVQGGVVHLRNCKYGKERRVEIGPIARAALEELRPWYNGTVLGGVKKAQITEWAHQAAVDSGLLPKVHGHVAHVLRASFATYLLRHGVAVEVVRDLMGHESIATTNVYASVEPEERRKAVDLL